MGVRARELFNSESPGGFPAAVSKVGSKLAKLKAGDYRLVLIDAKQVRSVPANAYYWGVILKYLCEAMGEPNRQKVHNYLKMKFNADCIMVKGEVVLVPGSTQGMGKKEFGAYMEEIIIWMLTEFNIKVPAPNEIPDDVYLEMIENGYVK